MITRTYQGEVFTYFSDTSTQIYLWSSNLQHLTF